MQSSVDVQVFIHANNTLISEELPLMERKVVKMRNGRFSIVWCSYNAQIQHIRSVYDTIGAPCFYLLHSCKLLGLVLKSSSKYGEASKISTQNPCRTCTSAQVLKCPTSKWPLVVIVLVPSRTTAMLCNKQQAISIIYCVRHYGLFLFTHPRWCVARSHKN